MKKLLSLFIVSIILCISTVIAQDNSYKVCGTTEMMEKAMQADPSYASRREMLEAYTRSYTGSNIVSKNSSGFPLYTIPVVFHVMHDYGFENISKAQIEDAMDIMNKSFQKLNDDTGDVIPAFQPIFADCEIQFRLAQIDPNGNCTDGITRHYTELTYTAGDNVKAIVDWPAHKYFNIWVVHTIASGAAGYAYFPGVAANIDGVVILHDYVGGIGTSNGSNYSERSLTHEVGHYLNLYHTWGPGNDPGLPTNCNLSDLVNDTPTTIGVANFSCNTAQVTCGSLDNVQNYMDYAGCHKMFTEGQRDRMHAALSSSVGNRDNLSYQPNLVATGTDDGFVAPPCAPTADFSNKVRMICTGNSLTFTDASWKSVPTSWDWTFPGGTPGTSTSQNPVITYNTPGVYDVTLTVSNAGGSHTLTRTGLVIVTPAVANYAVPYSESFETLPAFPGTNNEWFVTNTPGTSPWDLTALAAYTGVKSVRIYNFAGNGNGNEDEFITPSYDLTNVTNASLTFRLSFAHRSASSTDKLTVYVSKDCGLTWSVRYTKTGAALSTAGLILTNFVPTTASQWRLETASIATSTYNNQPNIRFKFLYKQNTGNNIYIDDLNLNGTVGIDENNINTIGLQITPNPAVTNAVISFGIEQAQRVRIKLLDVLGKELQVVADEKLNAGSHQYTIQAPAAGGIYLLKAETESTVITRRVVFDN